MLDSPLGQPLSRSSLVFLLVLDPLLHTPCISSSNHHLLFAAHAHTNAACSAVIPMLCHLYLVSLSKLLTWESFSLTPHIHLYLVCTSLWTDNHTSTQPLCFYRPDALPAAQPTASKHWRQVKKKWRKKGKWVSVRYKQENNAEIDNRIDKGTLRPRACAGRSYKQDTVQIGIDLSVAFNTVDHQLLLNRLRFEFGVTKYRSAGCSPISKAGPCSSRWASTYSHATEVDVISPL